jgi:MarR family transcriptional regulator, transcriptional regulator for hemolysin
MAERRLQDVIFYSLEAATKSYRRFAQARFDQAGLDITVDQWLVLKTLNDSPDLTLQQVGNAVFKDFASVTRIVQLLERKQYLHRKPHPTDGRRSELVLTRSGKSLLRNVAPIIHAYRRAALDGIDSGEVERMRQVLLRIIENCEGEAGGRNRP